MKKVSVLILVLMLLFSMIMQTACDLSTDTGKTDAGKMDTAGSGAATDNHQTTDVVKSVRLSATELAMTVGESAILTATVTPASASNKALTWSSTNSTVAEYIDGKVVAISEGRCVIKATSGNGKVASCTVTVSKAPVLAQEVSFPMKVKYMGIGETYSFTATIKPETADQYSGKITSTNPKAATVTYSGDENRRVVVTAKSKGETELTLQLDNQVSCSMKVIVVDLDELVVVKMPTLPQTVSYVHIRNYNNTRHICSSARITGIDVQKRINEQNVLEIFMTVHGIKTYDEKGQFGTQTVIYQMCVYENGTLVGNTQLDNYGAPGPVGCTVQNMVNWRIGAVSELRGQRTFEFVLVDYT